MENIENLKALGESLGYESDALRTFVKEQQDRLRDEPLAKWEELRVKDQREHEFLLKTCEKDVQEREREIEREHEEKEHECEEKAREFELQRKREAGDAEIKLKEQEKVAREREFGRKRER